MAEPAQPAQPARRGSGKPAKAPARRTPADPARLLAHAVLRAVSERDAYANLVLPGLLRESKLTTQQKAFVTELSYGTLRARGTLDAVITPSLSRGLDAVDGAVLDALRLGVYQLLSTRVPTHAAVTTTVDLAVAVAGRGAGGFTNAVLRSVVRRWGDSGEDLAVMLGAPSAETDPIGRLALLHNHPRWIVEAFRDALAGDLDQTRALLVADDDRPQTHLVARTIDRDELLRLARSIDAGATPAPWSSRGVHLSGGDPAGIRAVRSGQAAVQDEGSQLIALAVAAAAPGEGTTLDSCAGPGGKAALLATLLPGASMVAVERAPTRVGLVARALRHAPHSVVVTADGRHVPLPRGSADRVLVDAPCSGLGALRRRPEARWRRTPAEIGQLQQLQAELLREALRVVRPGGVVGYATCSPHVGETRDVVAGVLADPPDGVQVEQLDARPYFPGVPNLGDGPHVQLWPHRHGTDAMFLALLRRT